ncbi:MAG TPA: BON domain-containing protein [Candidatus Dormibacteraeota bacterium]
MKKELRARGEAIFGEAQSEIANYLELVRRLASQRLDEIDTKDVKRRSQRLSNQVTDSVTDAIVDGLDSVRDRIRPRPKQRPPVALIAIGGVVVGAGLAAYFLGRRQEVRERFTELTGPAQRRLPQLVGKSRGNGHGVNGKSFSVEESQLRTEVERAIESGGTPPGDLKVDVEGRTVYLRGHLPDRGYVDAAVERAQQVEGVAAVINLVSA